MTKQEYYNLLVSHSKQGLYPSVDVYETGTTGIICMYRSKDGKKCVAGELIPDDEYVSWMESKGALHVMKARWIPNDMMIGDILSIQIVHDTLARSGRPWDHTEFVNRLNELLCFKEMTKDEK